jgi:polyhydroxybutyrate depolymerase
MKRALVLALVALTASCSAGSPAPTAGPVTSPTVTLPAENPGPGDQSTAFLDGEGSVRHYLVHAPASYTPGNTYPLVVVFHGSPGAPEDMPDLTKMNEVADANNFLVVYPRNMFDTTVFAALLDHFVPKWSVDPKHIHVAGFSRGGSFVYQLAAAMPERFGSVAPVSASRNADVPLSQPLSLITFQGGADSLNVAWSTTNSGWDAAAGCSGDSITTTTMQNSRTYVHMSSCKDGTEHVVYDVSGMGHTWPADGSRLIWEFFAKHPLP